MRRALIFIVFILFGAGTAGAVSRDGTTVARATTNTSAAASRGTAQQNPSRTNSSPRAAATTTARTTTSRTAIATPSRVAVGSRAMIRPNSTSTRAATSRASVSRGATTQPAQSVVSRAAANPVSMADTRTGAEYERCKAAYFTCMDQFCALKNDDYRRCSCSDRVHKLGETRKVLQDAGQQLTVFNENLDVVGMTAAQAAAMRTASEGENALTSDVSASKALLQAIMNSIRGGDSNVSGKYSDLNSISISFDTVNAFGVADSGQLIAAYDGQNLYNAVYPQCRAAVAADCNNASLQRAINAYLMAVEQDCNTVQTAIEETQAQMKAAVRESSAMLDLARVENRQKHNSDDIATCLANVESAILSEEVCGANYHKCLDNGEFIDISTGAPIAGVVHFYELAELLSFADGVDAANQKLTRIYSNRTFVQNFESHTKKFAQPALDKCTEQADVVWEEYLDKAMLDIYYAQRAKVNEIKQGCFDFVSSCYMNGDSAMTSAMSSLIGESGIILQPYQVALTGQLCRDYVESCNNMFDGDIIAQYIENRQDTDTLTACRAVAQQCFDKFGGTNYENFYYPYSGLFTSGTAIDWFTLYEITAEPDETGKLQYKTELKSECAKQLAKIDVCNKGDMLETVFGGLDSINTYRPDNSGDTIGTNYDYKIGNGDTGDEKNTQKRRYGRIVDVDNKNKDFYHRQTRPTGVATEMYNQVIDILSTQCKNVGGRFVEQQFVKLDSYDPDNICQLKLGTCDNAPDRDPNAPPAPNQSKYCSLIDTYGLGLKENMCPRDYGLNVDTQSWGACLCWENGGRRSKWGKSATCMPIVPVAKGGTDTTPELTKPEDFPQDALCGTGKWAKLTNLKHDQLIDAWCSKTPTSYNQICPFEYIEDTNGKCKTADTRGAPLADMDKVPEGILK